MTNICFSVPGPEISLILMKLSRVSAQISGFSAGFHRKSLDIVKQHPNNAEIWLIVCFSPDIGEHKFDGTSSAKIGNWKKMGVLAIQKEAKTGNIGKKTPVAVDIDYVRYLSMQKVNLNLG